MCRTVYLHYICGCYVKKRLSVCRGTFGYCETGFDDAGRPYVRTKVYCHGNHGLTIRLFKFCAVCAAHEAVAQRYKSQDELQAMIKNFTHSLAVMIELEAREDGVIEKIQGRLEQAKATMRRYKESNSEYGAELRKKYPVPWPDEEKPMRNPVYGKRVNGRSLLRQEVTPEDVVLPGDTEEEVEEAIHLGATDDGAVFAETLKAYSERNTTFYTEQGISQGDLDRGAKFYHAEYDPSEEECEETEGAIEQEGERRDYGPAIALEAAEYDDEDLDSVTRDPTTASRKPLGWFAGEEEEEEDEEENEVGVEEGDDEEEGSATIFLTQVLAPRHRPTTPEEDRVPPTEQFTFAPPVKDLAASLHIPIGLVKPLQLIGKFSFEQLCPVASKVDPPRSSSSTSDILSDQSQTNHTLSRAASSHGHKFTSKNPVPGYKQGRTVMETRNSHAGEQDKKRHASNHHGQIVGGSEEKDVVIRRDSGCALNDTVQEESKGYLGVGYWNWTSTGT